MKKSKRIGLMLGACLLVAGGAGVGQASTAFAATTDSGSKIITAGDVMESPLWGKPGFHLTLPLIPSC